jgi:transposase
MNTERSNSILDTPPASCADSVLPDDVPTLQAMIRELLDALKKEQHEREGIQQRLDLLLRKLYGPKAERFNPEQPWLLPELAVEPPAQPEQTPNEELPTTEEPAVKKRRNGGRKKLPENLQRIRIEHALTEAERVCPCCNIACQKFGEDVSEQLDYQPGHLFVNQHVRFKYACTKCRDHITVGHAPIAVINKGLPGSGLLAHIAASKYADHLPPSGIGHCRIFYSLGRVRHAT